MTDEHVKILCKRDWEHPIEVTDCCRYANLSTILYPPLKTQNLKFNPPTGYSFINSSSLCSISRNLSSAFNQAASLLTTPVSF